MRESIHLRPKSMTKVMAYNPVVLKSTVIAITKAMASMQRLVNSTVFLLDIFSGTAGVTAAFIQLCGEALGLDHVMDKKRMRGPTSKVDLCKKENQEMVLQWLDEGKIDGVMLAPPCGTSSRAREIPVFQSGQKRRAPQPLRSARYPNGLPTLPGWMP